MTMKAMMTRWVIDCGRMPDTAPAGVVHERLVFGGTGETADHADELPGLQKGKQVGGR